MIFTARVRRQALSSCFGSAFGISWGALRLPARCQSLFAGLSVGRRWRCGSQRASSWVQPCAANKP